MESSNPITKLNLQSTSRLDSQSVTSCHRLTYKHNNKNLLLGAGLCSEFLELYSVTKPKLGLRLGTKVKILKAIFIAPLGFSLAFEWSWKTLIRKGCILMFFGFFLFINSSRRYTLYRHIVVVKATIDKQSPHAKLLRLNVSNEVEISSF